MANGSKQQTCATSSPNPAHTARFSAYLPFPKRSKKGYFRASVLVSPLAASSNSYGKYHISRNMTKENSQTPTLHLGQSNFDRNSPQASPLTAESPSPLTPRSARSPPASPYVKGSTIRSLKGPASDKSIEASKSSAPSTGTEDQAAPPTPGLTAIPPYPPSPRESTKHGGDAPKSFFTNLKGAKSAHRTLPSDGSSEHKPVSRGSSKDRSFYKSSRGRNESSPDLPTTSEHGEGDDDKNVEESTESHRLATKKSKPRFANILSRTRSIRVDDSHSNRPGTARRPSRGLLQLEETTKQDTQQPLRTAPLQKEGTFREAMDSTVRNRSVDRSERQDENNTQPKKERNYAGSMLNSSSLSQLTSSTMFNNLKQSSSGAADRLGKAGKGFLGRIARSGSGGERDMVTDDNYVCSVINLPLVDQTRRTRISKRLEDSKDKTEYWMPALPWRCIDYLNFNGCEEEGLYRVPGSGRDVKHWQRRFDTELDIDLFEASDLYDINTIGSMFKAWLRELPDEIFPKETQAMIAEKCPDATTAPQLLKDELSKLPPFNYYLLFAITCHLSLLHSYVDKNKMDYRNLCICFQPCMKIDGYCFQFLVCDWKNCWQGCWTEKDYLEIELGLKNSENAKGKNEQPPEQKSMKARKQQNGNSKPIGPGTVVEERAVCSSSSSNKSSGNHGKSNGEDTHSPSRSTSPKRARQAPPANIDSSHSRSASQLPELGPPLSPIKI